MSIDRNDVRRGWEGAEDPEDTDCVEADEARLVRIAAGEDRVEG